MRLSNVRRRDDVLVAELDIEDTIVDVEARISHVERADCGVVEYVETWVSLILYSDEGMPYAARPTDALHRDIERQLQTRLVELEQTLRIEAQEASYV